ncbi:uncharacterized protein [Clytia hemisphaerica]|uniref:G-protein coupled receptors family 3 profile domain-containing protein n=1 Tax=Clytia hemisphaerica TaxID=252671 RepID=A0A7M5WJ47_9CNID
MMTTKHLLSILIILMTIHNAFPMMHPLNREYTIVKLITRCDGRNIMGNEISKQINETIGHVFSFVYEFIEFDICDEKPEEGQFQLTRLLSSLLLEPRWRRKIETNDTYYLSPKWDQITSSDEYRILGIVTYLSHTLLQRTIEILKFSKIMIYPMTRQKESSEWFERQETVLPAMQREQSTESIIKTLLKKHSQWKNILIIELITKKQPQPSLRIEMIQRRFQSRRNIRYWATPDFMKKKDTIFQKLKKESSDQLVIVVGGAAGIFMALAQREHNITNPNWILFANLNRQSGLPDYVCFIGVLGHLDVTTLPLYHNKTFCAQKRTWRLTQINKSRHKNQINLTCGMTTQKLEKTIEIQMSQSIIHMRGVFQEKNSYQIEQLRNKTLNTVDRIDDINFGRPIKRKMKFNINTTIEFCEHVEVRHINYSSDFVKQCDYTCLKCQNTSYLDKGSCHMCVGGEIPNNNQTACYYPFEESNNDIIYHITTVFDTLGIILCLFILTVFIKYRNTPVVRSSHFTLSMLQVICCLSLFVIFMSSVSLEPDVFRCTSRQYGVSLLLIIVNAIVVCKSEMIITICSMKTVLCRKTKRDLFRKQALIFILIVVIDLSIMGSSFPHPSRPIVNIKRTDAYGNKYLTLACDLGEKSYLQVAYCIFLLMLSLGQAMRGHGRLPDAYNEGNAIIASSATSACCLLFLLIYGSMSKVSIKQNDFVPIICITLSINLITLILCLYSSKIYIIIFQKKRNTKSFVKTFNKQMEYVAKHCDSRRRKVTQMSRMTSVTFVQSETLMSSEQYESDCEPFDL